MFSMFLDVVIVLAVFWVAVITAYYLYFLGDNVLFATPLPTDEPEDILERQERLDQEAAVLEQDLRDVRIAQEAGDRRRPELVELGIAENKTVNQQDEVSRLQGDHWLCSGRPLWFALLYQLLPAWLLAVGFHATVNYFFPLVDAESGERMDRWPQLLEAAASVGVVTILWGLLGFIQVRENTVLGVKRFGEQMLGYLRPGPQFILPLIEEPEDVPFYVLVWGPHSADGSSADYHIGGVAARANPEPGIVRVVLQGAWKVTVNVQVTLRVRKATKLAWWNFLNLFRSTEEIGEQIAAAVNAVLFTRVREMEEEREGTPETAATEEGREGRPETAAQTRESGAVAAVKEFKELQNGVPEISGDILRTLQRMGNDRLGGILPISVAIAGVTPDEELLQWLQVEDEAKIKRRQQQLEGEGVLLRSRQLQEVVQGITDPAIREAFLHLSAQEVQRIFAQTGSQNSIEGLVRAFMAGKVQDVTAVPPSRTSPSTES